METFTIKNLTFTYPQRSAFAIEDINLGIESGEFTVICGQSGSGKSTLLRNLKPVLTPHGTRNGQILFYGEPLEDVEQSVQAQRIGYVLQSPDNQIVTDKVWHELAFGLESLGYDTQTIRLRVAEMASFFGIQTWFMKDVNQLSGGQKQLLNLASVMAMQPDILILDEPTAQLDPISAGDFLETVKKINLELGTTILMTEHRLEDVIPMADRAVVMDGGTIFASGKPVEVGNTLFQKQHPMFTAMPTPLQAYILAGQKGIAPQGACPINVREGRKWLTDLWHEKELTVRSVPLTEMVEQGTPILEMKDIWFKYDKRDDDVIKDLSLQISEGEFFCIVGGNGTGKTTTLNLAAGINKPYRGNVLIHGKNIKSYKGNQLFDSLLGMLPQNPQTIFVEKTVRTDLLEMFEGSQVEPKEQEEKLHKVVRLVEIEDLLDCHPYDLSGGEQQRAALAKVLLLEPKILLLDEPTKGLDSHFKEKLAVIFRNLLAEGITIIMVSHDIEFCSRYASRCALFFDGKVITSNEPGRFFSGNSFYTTAANRMSRHIFENVVTVDDLVWICEENWI